MQWGLQGLALNRSRNRLVGEGEGGKFSLLWPNAKMPDLATDWGWVVLLFLVTGWFARQLWENTRKRTGEAEDAADENRQSIIAHKERVKQLEQNIRGVKERISRLEESIVEIRRNSIDRDDLDRFEARIGENLTRMKSALDQRFDALMDGISIDEYDANE